jgi:hypothetical protein
MNHPGNNGTGPPPALSGVAAGVLFASQLAVIR